ncbi:unnamed protein product [Lactuca virosa]|uniref:Ubiquitin-like protease family profile domain-containing protein n=1 Tax=Lactuca virosa TaxID=75947 RepID=A0AAU9NBD2_9ASTR|nr:unnamed protein product [Lactuca virosa]
MSKKVDKAFKKHGNLKLIEFYGLKVKELCSVYKAFRHSNSKSETTFESYDKSSSCDDKFSDIGDFGIEDDIYTPRKVNKDPAYMHSKICKSDDEYNKFKENVVHWLEESKVRRNLKGIDLYMTWKTRGNSNDCGIFLMRHMETYKGGALAQWTCGFKMETVEQIYQLRKLRRRYCLKILLSEVNIMKHEVEQLIDEYQKLSTNDRCVLYDEGIINIGARLAAFGP